MLGFRSDFGVSGYLDPEVGELLLQLILTEGSPTEFSCKCGGSVLSRLLLGAISLPHFSFRFASDPDRVGAEKLSVTAVPKAYLESEYKELPAVIGSA